MNIAAIRHRPCEEYIYPSGRNCLNIRVVTERSETISVSLLYWARYESDPRCMKTVRMEAKLRDKYNMYFDARIVTPDISAYTRYCFLIEDGDQRLWYAAKGFSDTEPAFNADFFEFLWPNPSDSYKAPAWAGEQVYYQIFPERFCNGDDELSPKLCEPWGSAPTRENFMGGDLAGILEKIDYLSELGISCVYTTPIFEAPSNHKYDTVNYYEIDPHFGTKADLKRLVDELHKRGIRMILDGVFNHCGYFWPFFQDVCEKGEASEYKDWFFIHSFPVSSDVQNYDCVGHYKWMPKINLDNEEALEYFLQVGRYWIENFGIDGWRLDVADELPSAFLERFSREMKKASPDVLILGETWGDAQRLLCVDRLDTAMNYLFRNAAEAWIAKGSIGAGQFDHEVNRLLALYPYETELRMYNPLDSHDTARFLNQCSERKELLKLASALQMTFPGSPAVYYGDELGMTGENDPDCRRAMPWRPDEQDRELLDHYKKLICLRKNSKSLTRGDFRTLLSNEESNTYAFIRQYEDEQTVVIINRGDKAFHAELPLKPGRSQWMPVFGDDSYLIQQNGAYSVDVPACCVKIYQNQESKVSK